jgi:hypothetical protein
MVEDLHQDSILARFAHCIDLKVTELGELAFRITFVLDALIAALAGRVGGHGGNGLPQVSNQADYCCARRQAEAGYYICKMLSSEEGQVAVTRNPEA